MAAQTADSGEQLPLKGIVLCCTSLPTDVRTKLADAACQMGAVHKLDLTSDVTHLLVANINTAKYRYVAKERPDIRVLSPDFVEAVRQAWMEGTDVVDIKVIEKKYELPPFYGLEVCFTGFQEPIQRKEMEDTVVANGGKYHGDLTKQVTHLIALKPEGQKYKFGKQWEINVVSLKWYEDSLVRGMAVDEKLYLPEMPIAQQGVGAFRTKPKRPSLGKRGRDDSQGPGGEDSCRRKLRKVASMRLDSQSQDMWRDMSAHEVQVEATELDAWNDESQTMRTSERPQSKGNFARPAPAMETPRNEPTGLFAGHFIFIHGFEPARAKKLRHFLEPNGAIVVDSAESLGRASESLDCPVRCLLLPHAQPVTLPDVPSGTILVTEWWVERCIHYKQHLDPLEDHLSSPLSNSIVSGFASLTISTTGFDGVDLRQTAEAVKLMGATYQELLLSSTSVLVCASASVKKEKAIYAWKHNIPIVTPDWLWSSLKSRKQASFDRFRIELPAFDSKDVADLSASTPAPSEASQLPIRQSAEHAKRPDDPFSSKRLSNTRRRHATPSLPLQASKSSEQRRPRPGPFILEDDDDEAAPITADDQSVPLADECQPLREISPNTSPQKKANSDPKHDNAEDVVVEKAFGPPSQQPVSPPKSPMKDNVQQKHNRMDELASDLRSIIARQASSNPANPSTEPQKRKQRPLGRNLSAISNHSGSASASPNLPSEVPESNAIAEGAGISREPPSLPPSTQVGYDTPEAEAHRRQMSKKLGTSFLEDEIAGRRPASMPTVKDSIGISSRTATTAAGTRTKSRRNKT